MNDAIFYAVAAAVALLPIGKIIGVRLLLMKANRSVAPRVEVKQRNALRYLSSTSLLLVDMDSIQTSHAVHALATARRAGIRVCLMTTGAARTAAAVHLGYADSKQNLEVVSGKEIHGKTFNELAALFHEGRVLFSHLTPESKVHLITQAQQQGETVTIATSNIDDILPLEYASVGVAIGASASSRAAETADIIIRNGDITTLISAIQAGRTVHDNIRKATLASLTGNATAFCLVAISGLAALVSHIPPAFTVMHILVITTLAGCLPSIFLVGDRAESNPMHRSPRAIAKPLVGLAEIAHVAWNGLLASGLAYINYMWFFNRNNLEPSYLTAGSSVHSQALGIALLTAILCILVYTVQVRSAHGFFSRYQWHNGSFWATAAGTLVAALAILSASPTPMRSTDVFLAVCGGALFLALREFQRHNRKHHRKAVLELHRSITAKPAH